LKLGAFFETWVVNYLKEQGELISSVNFYHWRSHGGAELDLLIERDGVLFPIEIKCKSKPKLSDASSIQAFRKTYPKAKIMPGLVIHAGEETYLLDQQTLALSWKAM
jgi:predicted AAA+ superfamily ATPase